MKIKSAAFVLLVAVCTSAFAADSEALYTCVGADPKPAELLAIGMIVPGESFSKRTVLCL